MATNDVYRLTVRATFLGSVVMNDLSFRLKSATEPTVSDFAQLAVRTKDIYRLQQHPNYTYVGWRALQMRGGTVSYVTKPCNRVGGLVFEGLFTSNTTGAGNGVDPLPPQVAHVTTLVTGRAGRSYRGRVYAGGWGEDTQASGSWTSTLSTALSTAWTTFGGFYISPAGTDPMFELGVWSMRLATGCVPNPTGGMTNNQPANPDGAYTAVQSFALRNTVYTQRRRVFGVGV